MAVSFWTCLLSDEVWHVLWKGILNQVGSACKSCSACGGVVVDKTNCDLPVVYHQLPMQVKKNFSISGIAFLSVYLRRRAKI